MTANRSESLNLTITEKLRNIFVQGLYSDRIQTIVMTAETALEEESATVSKSDG
jgi:hypothetical protein